MHGGDVDGDDWILSSQEREEIKARQKQKREWAIKLSDFIGLKYGDGAIIVSPLCPIKGMDGMVYELISFDPHDCGLVGVLKDGTLIKDPELDERYLE